MANDPVLITFVCWGNICRSPAAEVVMRKLVADAGLSHAVVVDSSGTGNWHVGGGADAGTEREAKRRGYPIDHRARQFTRSDFEVYNYIVALDSERAADLEQMASTDTDREKIVLLRSFDPDADHVDVPDPYGEGADAFELIFDQIEPACEGLLAHIRSTHSF